MPFGAGLNGKGFDDLHLLLTIDLTPIPSPYVRHLWFLFFYSLNARFSRSWYGAVFMLLFERQRVTQKWRNTSCRSASTC